MKTTRNAVAVGFVTILIVAGLYFALKFVAETGETKGQYRVFAVFKDASGLIEGSRVRIAGIPVGYIEKIDLAEYAADAGVDAEGRGRSIKTVGARVDLMVQGGVKLFSDAAAVTTTGSILGDKFIVLLPGDPVKKRLQEGDQIFNTGEAGLLGGLEQLSQDIGAVTNNLKKVFGSEEGGRQMGEVLANLRDISRSINDLLKQNSEIVNRTLNNVDGIAAEARPNVKEIVENIRVISRDLRVFVEQSSPKAGSAVSEVDGTLKDVRKAVAKLDKTLENLATVSDGVAKGEGTVGRLLKDDKLIDDVEEVVESAGGFLKGITQLKTIVGLSGEFNFYDNTMKTTLQLRLQPREDKYYLIEAIYDPRGATSRTETVVESTNPDEPAQYREVRHVTRDSLLFSLMFARRLRFATFRFGVKESSGGLGLDIHLLRDRFELSTDIYRFGSDVYPRLKEMIAVEFLKHLYVIGGINDVLNDNRDYFIGAMLRFNDEDLKTILPFAPSGAP